MSQFEEVHKQIEDIIDANKESGQYDVLISNLKPLQNTRYAYSTPAGVIDELRDELVYNIEGDNNNDLLLVDLNHVGSTDSEITLIRVKREGSQYRTQVGNNWDMHDTAIPGDGTHLGESPSLVNLVTLIKQFPKSKREKEQEYMVPLSSWEPIEPQTDEASIQNCEEEQQHNDQEKPSTSVQLKPNYSTSSFKEIFKCFMFWKRTQTDDESIENAIIE